MAGWDSSQDPARVVIAGGGFAAVEAALAVRALAGDRVELTMIAPDSTFLYRAAAPLDVFDSGPPTSYDLRAIAKHVRAQYRQALIEFVGAEKRYLRASSGIRLQYDALILATGARASVGIPGAMTFRDQRDARLVRPLLNELEAGAIRRVVFAVPPGCTWSLPLYELALLVSVWAEERGVRAELSLVTPEHAPLAAFGIEGARLVADLLADRGVRFVGDAVPMSVRRDGALALQADGAIAADRVVAVPILRGRRIAGVPASWWGFVPVDVHGRVDGRADVYAAGDMTTFPVKQGGLATQQADRVAHTIAARLGIPVKQFRAEHVLQTRLLGGERPIFLRIELDAWGHPTRAALHHSDRHCADSGKVSGRYLTPYLETLERIAETPDSRPAAA